MLFSGAPAGTRTLDTRLKRAVLYLLSYWGIFFFVSQPRQRLALWLGKEEGGRLSAVFVTPDGNEANRASSDALEPASSDEVAGMAGLEPTISESKSGVLPLHYIPSTFIN